MVSARECRVALLYRYPIKGLSGERLRSVDLDAGQTFPMDRAYALENGPSGFDPTAPTWQPKIKFLCLMRNARLASLSTRYDDASHKLTIKRGEETLAVGDLSNKNGCKIIEQFFEKFMETEKRGPIRVLNAPNHSFSDVAKKVVSIINLATLADLEDRLRQPVHPLRFRANFYFEGLPAWSEFNLIGKKLRIGSIQARVVKRIERCAATEVNPETAIRDLSIPEILYRMKENADLGIYADITAPGKVAEGDPITILG
jgi:uncharacterized protein YcbX